MSLQHPILFDSANLHLSNTLKNLKFSKAIVFCDENTEKFCLSKLPILNSLEKIVMQAGEVNKNIATCEMAWQTLIDLNADRNTLLINVGGGVVTDIGGFIASVYKRGIQFINIPTSLLAMVDASTGGKTGCNFGKIKNSIGAFSTPEVVLIDPLFLETLPSRHIKNGQAEVVKHGLIASKKHLEKISTFTDGQNWLPIIKESIAIKQAVVKSDPFESGKRKILNFGHTIGHAIESFSLSFHQNPLLHGEAIALGMIAEAFLSKKYCSLSDDEFLNIRQLINQQFNEQPFTDEECKTMMGLIKNDKKNSGQAIKMSLISAIGQAEYDIEVTEADCLASLKILG